MQQEQHRDAGYERQLRRAIRPCRPTERRVLGLAEGSPCGKPASDHRHRDDDQDDPKRDRHMRSASLALLGADEIRTEWTELAEGKAVLVVKSHLVRKAR